MTCRKEPQREFSSAGRDSQYASMARSSYSLGSSDMKDPPICNAAAATRRPARRVRRCFSVFRAVSAVLGGLRSLPIRSWCILSNGVAGRAPQRALAPVSMTL
eukprot:1188818-Prorocentrum_minimum.AAC.3